MIKKLAVIILIISVAALAFSCSNGQTEPASSYRDIEPEPGDSVPEREYTPFHPETDTHYAYVLDTPYTDSGNPVVTLFLSDGSWLSFELYPELAPIAVQRFIDLVNNLLIEGSYVHSIEQNYLLCGGAIVYNGQGYPQFIDVSEYANLPAETNVNGRVNNLKHEFGVIGFCLEENNYNSVGTQFYVCLDTLSEFDGYSPAFGRITGDESYDVLCRLNNAETEYYNSALPDLPLEPVEFVFATITYNDYTPIGD